MSKSVGAEAVGVVMVVLLDQGEKFYFQTSVIISDRKSGTKPGCSILLAGLLTGITGLKDNLKKRKRV